MGEFTGAHETRESLQHYRQLFDARDDASFHSELRATLPTIEDLAERSEKVFPLYDYLNGLSKETSR